MRKLDLDKIISQRIQKLRNEIARLRSAYHVENAPNATDDVYDSLTRELRELLKKYPEFENPNAPENRVAGKVLDKFVKLIDNGASPVLGENEKLDVTVGAGTFTEPVYDPVPPLNKLVALNVTA